MVGIEESKKVAVALGAGIGGAISIIKGKSPWSVVLSKIPAFVELKDLNTSLLPAEAVDYSETEAHELLTAFYSGFKL